MKNKNRKDAYTTKSFKNKHWRSKKDLRKRQSYLIECLVNWKEWNSITETLDTMARKPNLFLK